jgi:CubicO group peptidase (beta-lactamase class C family)
VRHERVAASSIRLARALLIASSLAFGPFVHADEAIAWPTSGWQSSTPEEQGMSSAALADLVEFGARNAMDSMLIARHGRIVLDTSYAPFKPGMKHVVNSVTKGVVGTLAGIAFKDGALGPLDAPVMSFFPGRNVANLDANKKAMSLQSLLDSTSGLSWREPLSAEPPESMLQMERSPDWVGFVLDRPMAQAPDVSFNYDSGTWHLVSAIVGKQTGADTLAYAKQTLFGPLGIADVSWRRDPQGVPIGGYGLFMQPRDMAKIGYLYLHRGQWEGRQVLSREWVDKVFNPKVAMQLGTFRYANGWWTLPERHAHMAVGYLRQLIIVLPDTDAVVVVTGRRHYPFEQLIDRVVAAAKSPLALPADPAANARLAERIADAAVEKASPVATAPAIAASVSGKTFRIDANWTGLSSIKLDLRSPDPRYETVFAPSGPNGSARRIDGPIGLDGLFRLREPQGSEPLLAVKGTWLNESSFQLISRSLLEGVVTTYVLTFNAGQLDISLEDNRGVRLRMRGQAAD